MSTKKTDAMKWLEARHGPMTVAHFVRSWREADEISQASFAKRLGLSRANLCDIEKGRKLVSPERAAKFAKVLKVPEMLLVQLALQDVVRNAQLRYIVKLEGAS